mmetsp:Transcript_22991/g.35514  ORF Transcript_22991/g.35514 Transcript_22991/m.35514 type:complete len:230 (-) Transcript_22991:420-1109(-)
MLPLFLFFFVNYETGVVRSLLLATRGNGHMSQVRIHDFPEPVFMEFDALSEVGVTHLNFNFRPCFLRASVKVANSVLRLMGLDISDLLLFEPLLLQKLHVLLESLGVFVVNSKVGGVSAVSQELPVFGLQVGLRVNELLAFERRFHQLLPLLLFDLSQVLGSLVGLYLAFHSLLVDLLDGLAFGHDSAQLGELRIANVLRRLEENADYENDNLNCFQNEHQHRNFKDHV